MDSHIRHFAKGCWIYHNRMKALVLLLVLAIIAGPVGGALVSQPHSTAELIAEHREVAPGQVATLALRLKLEKGWHVYWRNPGDSGMATSIAWQLPEEFSAGPIQWPTPHRIDVGPITSYGYDNEVLLLTDVAVPANFKGRSAEFRAKADWLVCKEICIPASADLDANVTLSNTTTRDTTRSALFDRTRTDLPSTLIEWNAVAGLRGADLVIKLTPTREDGAPLPEVRKLMFYPHKEGDIDDAATQESGRAGRGYELVVKRAPGTAGISKISGVLAAQPSLGRSQSAEIDLPVGIAAPLPAATRSITLAIAIGLAFAGGLILNLMPCVFPVLAIKILGVLERAHGERGKLMRHGFLFAAGVVTSFLAIAGLLLVLRAQGAALGWGFQLQAPLVVTGLALLFFALGLNMSGVFQFGTRVQSATGDIRFKNETLDALASGLLATVVATPCTAPFMGVALGYAVTQPTSEALVVFASIALGMAVPYVLLCSFPAALRKLPRPGPWMETLKQFLAFPLYATVVWLIWVLGHQVGIDGAARALLALVFVACSLWLWGRPHAHPPYTLIRPLVCAGLLAGAAILAWPSGRPETSLVEGLRWSPWSDAAVKTALDAGQPVFVDFTAAWCVSCQVNKQLVLHSDQVERGFSESRVLRLRADWTKRDPAITAAMDRLGRNGVPIYALYIPGAAEPKLLPEILTTGIVLDALAQLPVRVTKVDQTFPRSTR